MFRLALAFLLRETVELRCRNPSNTNTNKNKAKKSVKGLFSIFKVSWFEFVSTLAFA